MASPRRHVYHWSKLNESTSKSRYGVAYLRAICSQAGVGFTETPSEEDTEAVDCDIKFKGASVYVQVKCSSQFSIGDNSTATWPAQSSWIESWRDHMNPVYLVLVLVDPVDQELWLEHRHDGTWHRTAAYWRRVDNLRDEEKIVIPKKQRLSVETLAEWYDDLCAAYDPQRRT